MPKRRTPTESAEGTERETTWGDGEDGDVRAEWDAAFKPAEEGVPETVPLHLAESIRDLDTGAISDLAEWVEVLARRREIEAENAAEVGSGADSDATGGANGTIIEKYQQCGKAECACASGDEGDMHGPYQYRVTGDGDGGQTWEYIGKA